MGNEGKSGNNSYIVGLTTLLVAELYLAGRAENFFVAGINEALRKNPNKILAGLENTARETSQNSLIPRICERADLIKALNCWRGNIEYVGQTINSVEQTINFYGQMIQTVVNHPQTLIPLLSEPKYLIGTAMVLTPIVFGALWLSKRNH
jgi:hypothetical protein